MPRKLSDAAKAKKYAYNAAYTKKNYIKKAINLRPDVDADIFDMLASVPNATEYIKDLIRSDITKRKAEESK